MRPCYDIKSLAKVCISAGTALSVVLGVFSLIGGKSWTEVGVTVAICYGLAVIVFILGLFSIGGRR